MFKQKFTRRNFVYLTWAVTVILFIYVFSKANTTFKPLLNSPVSFWDDWIYAGLPFVTGLAIGASIKFSKDK
jgi:hypothetical protein